MIVNTGVRQVRRHASDRARASEVEEVAVAGGVELQERRSELKALGPFGPAARPILTVDGEDRRAVVTIPAALDRSNLAGGELEHAVDVPQQIARRARSSRRDHLISYVMRTTRSSAPVCLRPCELPGLVRIAVPGPTSTGLSSSVITPRPLRT